MLLYKSYCVIPVICLPNDKNSVFLSLSEFL